MFAQKLKKLRTENGYSQRSLAKELKITPSAIGNYESGIRQPDNDTLLKLSRFFGVSVDYLITSDEKNEICKYIDNLANEMLVHDSLMFNGKPLDKNAVEKVIEAMKIGMREALEEQH